MLKEMGPEELVAFFTRAKGEEGEPVPKRIRRRGTFSLSALDIWADKSESVQMVAALSWWCDVIVMREAVRAILAFDEEREQIVWGAPVEGPLLERWFGMYCRIPGLKRSPRKGVFAAVVNSFMTGHQHLRIVWSGKEEIKKRFKRSSAGW